MKRLVTPNKHSEEINYRYRYRYRNRNRRVIHSPHTFHANHDVITATSVIVCALHMGVYFDSCRVYAIAKKACENKDKTQDPINNPSTINIEYFVS